MYGRIFLIYSLSSFLVIISTTHQSSCINNCNNFFSRIEMNLNSSFNSWCLSWVSNNCFKITHINLSGRSNFILKLTRDNFIPCCDTCVLTLYIKPIFKEEINKFYPLNRNRIVTPLDGLIGTITNIIQQKTIL